MDKLAAYLQNRYSDYLDESPNLDWLGEYKCVCEITAKIGELLGGIAIDAGIVEEIDRNTQFMNSSKENLEAPITRENAMEFRNWPTGGEPAMRYLENMWIPRDSNGITNVGQGSITKDTFDAMVADPGFWPPFVGMIRLATGDPGDGEMAAAYTALITWMNGFAEKRSLFMFSAVVNRFAAACLPGKVSSIAAEGPLNRLLTELDAWQLLGNAENWLLKNRFLLRTLGEPAQQCVWVDDSPHRRSIFFWWLLQNIVRDDSPQIVLYGSPGTGKTYAAKARADSGIKSWQGAHANGKYGKKETIQFHPSFTYEDFIEGIRPSKEDNGPLSLKLVPGHFKRFCFEAAKWEIDFLRSGKVKLDEDTKVTDLGDGKKDTPLWDFLKNVPQDDRVIDHLPPYYFIIDEINRAELSRVLGETMLALEYRGAKNAIKTQYSYLCTDEAHEAAFLMEGKDNYFFIPYNIRVIGTMNVIDRSVEAFDLALRRRFRWEELTFDENAMRSILLGKIQDYIDRAIKQFMALNQAITDSPLLGKDYIIGHAYAKYLTEYKGHGGVKNALEYVWQNHLEPLLYEYLRGKGRQQEITGLIKGPNKSFKVAFDDWN